jgi:hypothetical protein
MRDERYRNLVGRWVPQVRFGQSKDTMAGYRCYILDAENHIFLAYDVECGDDAHAEQEARDLLAQNPYHRSVEVWQSTRRITKLDRDQ